MTIQEAKAILDAVGGCLCGHFETCSVCTRPQAQRDIERKCKELLAKAGCGIKFDHVIGYARICTHCGKYIKPKQLKLKRRKLWQPIPHNNR